MEDIEVFYREYSKDLFNHLFWLTHDPDLSEELLQETFLQAIKSIHTFRGESSVKTWLYSIARHLWIDQLRKKRIITTDEDISEIMVAQNFENDLLDQAVVKKIHELLQTKEDKVRNIFLLRVNGYSYHEIAERVMVSESSARVIDYRTRKWLKGIIEEEGYLL